MAVMSRGGACGGRQGSFDIGDGFSYIFFMENGFDTLKFYEELKAADVPEKQAKIQAEAMRSAFAAYDAGKLKELATKGDLREAELRLQKGIQQVKYDMLKWQFGIVVALGAIMAKGFGWLGF